jgi:hypothetical protein
MYRFSRSIYRELAPRVIESQNGLGDPRKHVLEACEATMERIVRDGRYFAKPAKSLFCEVRDHFPISQQGDVFRVIDRNIRLAITALERMPAEFGLDTMPRQCRASTRKGTPCQREPLPGRDYCPSHKHLEEPTDSDGTASRAPVAA